MTLKMLLFFEALGKNSACDEPQYLRSPRFTFFLGGGSMTLFQSERECCYSAYSISVHIVHVEQPCTWGDLFNF